MPTADQHQSFSSLKCLYVGDSGSGKTGSLAPLVKSHEVVVLDFDNGLDVLVRAVKKFYPDRIKSLKYETLTDPMQSVGGVIIPDGIPQAWVRAMQFVATGRSPTLDLGPVKTWGPNRILVVDSLTFAGRAAMRHVMAVNNRIGKPPEIQHWGEAVRLLEEFLALLYTEAMKCHVIVISHIEYQQSPDGIERGFASTLGKKLPPRVGRYFNLMIRAKTVGSGQSAKRRIITTPDGQVELKSPDPWSLKPEYPIESGIEEIFETLLQQQTGDNKNG